MASYIFVRRTSFSIVRFLSIMLMLAAWGLASNRCVIATMLVQAESARAAAVHQCCPVQPAGGEGHAPEKRFGECCQGLSALLVGANAKLVEARETLPACAWVWAVLTVLEPQQSGEVGGRKKDPPGSRSFAEVVLQRSLLSHAPPRVV